KSESDGLAPSWPLSSVLCPLVSDLCPPSSDFFRSSLFRNVRTSGILFPALLYRPFLTPHEVMHHAEGLRVRSRGGGRRRAVPTPDHGPGREGRQEGEAQGQRRGSG